MKYESSDSHLLSYTVDCLTTVIERAEQRGDQATVRMLRRARDDVVMAAMGPGKRRWWEVWRR